MDNLDTIISTIEIPSKATIVAEKLVPASSTSLSQMGNCSKAFDAKYVTRSVKWQQNAAALYGSHAHEAIENHLRGDVPIPEQFLLLPKLQRLMDYYRSRNGFSYKHVEQDLAINDGGACKWNQRSMGVKADLLLYPDDPRTMWYVDWKTQDVTNYKGDKKPPKLDQVQAELTAICAFVSKPELQRLVVVMEFLKHGKRIVCQFDRSKPTYTVLSHAGNLSVKEFITPLMLSDYWMRQRAKRFEENPTPLCSWCDVTQCRNWKPTPVVEL